MLKKILYYLKTKPIKKIGKKIEFIIYNNKLATCVKEDNEKYPYWRIDLFYDPETEVSPEPIFLNIKNYRVNTISFKKFKKLYKTL